LGEFAAVIVGKPTPTGGQAKGEILGEFAVVIVGKPTPTRGQAKG